MSFKSFKGRLWFSIILCVSWRPKIIQSNVSFRQIVLVFLVNNKARIVKEKGKDKKTNELEQGQVKAQ